MGLRNYYVSSWFLNTRPAGIEYVQMRCEKMTANRLLNGNCQERKMRAKEVKCE